MYIPARKLKLQARIMTRKATKFKWLVLISFLLIAFLSLSKQEKKPVIKVSPVEASASASLAPHGVIQEVIAKEPDYIEGEASYYSRAGCLGCNEARVMANGQVLDDEALTLALTPEEVSKGKRLNDIVTVQNVDNGKTVKAKVTDTGGFAKYNRVADLSVATKNAVKCSSLCHVKIIFD